MTREQIPTTLAKVPEIKARLEAYNTLRAIKKLDGHELPPSVEGRKSRVLEAMVIRHFHQQTTTNKDLAPIYGEPITTPKIIRWVLQDISGINEIMKIKGSRWTIENVSAPEGKAKRLLSAQAAWDLVWDSKKAVPEYERVKLPNGKNLPYQKGNVKGEAIKLLSHEEQVPQSELEALLSPDQLKEIEKTLGKHGFSLTLTKGHDQAYYSMEKRPEEIVTQPKSPGTQNDPESSTKKVPLKDLEILNKLVGVEFTHLIIQGIATAKIKEMSRKLTGFAVFENIMESENIYRDIDLIFSEALSNANSDNHSKDAEIMEGLTLQNKSQKIIEAISRIRNIILDEDRTAKEVAKHLLINTLFEEWHRDPNDPKASNKQRGLRFWAAEYKRQGIGLERTIKIAFKHFRISDPAIPTFSPGQKSPEVPAHS